MGVNDKGQLINSLKRRLFYEPRALELAIPLLNAEDIINAERILVHCELTSKAGSRVELALSFHLRLMQACNDKSLLEKIADGHGTVLRHLSDEVSVVSAGERAQHQLWRLLGFCRQAQISDALHELRRGIEGAVASVSKIVGKLARLGRTDLSESFRCDGLPNMMAENFRSVVPASPAHPVLMIRPSP
ncbi:hypothetical protein LB519_08730 [Mesorhizobium sp. AD1-1]|uniref:hypothetical protein n=1 Tax=Mesorhizobium sp. AD1-1 TaxID=2876621 RepID=UPI001CCEFAFB|nr:hypothetical protein [Mesorhizobium sp. AD1-1]MBZ9717932.1 hypothetical protein [Mesorhizobium sp. AD1-1]